MVSEDHHVPDRELDQHPLPPMNTRRGPRARPDLWHQAATRRTSPPSAPFRLNQKSRKGLLPNWEEAAWQAPVGTTRARFRLCRDVPKSYLTKPCSPSKRNPAPPCLTQALDCPGQPSRNRGLGAAPCGRCPRRIFAEGHCPKPHGQRQDDSAKCAAQSPGWMPATSLSIANLGPGDHLG